MSFYAVAKGLNPGIYSNWSECQNQVKGFKGAKYKKFSSEEDAKQFIEQHKCIETDTQPIIEDSIMNVEPEYYVYTDGACSNNGNNQALAGMGVYFGENDERNVSKQLFSKPTNNVAELSAMICACNIIESDLKLGKYITIVSDSNYSILCATTYGRKNALQNWEKDIPNKDLVKQLFNFTSQYCNLQFLYIQAHTNKQDVHSIGNYHADLLATSSIQIL
jgi:ribonuclease HI